jgi:hypothetical protein
VPQVDKNVEREILNHRMLLNANVVSFKEVSKPAADKYQTPSSQLLCFCTTLAAVPFPVEHGLPCTVLCPAGKLTLLWHCLLLLVPAAVPDSHTLVYSDGVCSRW